MFLTEVALGKEHSITNDDSSLTKAPQGSDCVIARGTTEPGTVFVYSNDIVLVSEFTYCTVLRYFINYRPKTRHIINIGRKESCCSSRKTNTTRKIQRKPF